MQSFSVTFLSRSFVWALQSRDWIRAVAFFRTSMGISVSEVAFGDVIFFGQMWNPGTSPIVLSHGQQHLEHTPEDDAIKPGAEGREGGRDKMLSDLSPVASTRTTWSRVLLRELLQTKYPACVQVG